MKKGIFQLVFLFTLITVLPSCATFIDFGYSGVDESDRGLAATEETDDNCTGRFCDNPTAEPREQLLTDEERRVNRAIEARDIILGMSRQQVSSSWGEPSMRETAGSGTSGHERWTYGSKLSLSGSRVVIFENGKVAGWNR